MDWTHYREWHLEGKQVHECLTHRLQHPMHPTPQLSEEGKNNHKQRESQVTSRGILPSSHWCPRVCTAIQGKNSTYSTARAAKDIHSIHTWTHHRNPPKHQPIQGTRLLWNTKCCSETLHGNDHPSTSPNILCNLQIELLPHQVPMHQPSHHLKTRTCYGRWRSFEDAQSVLCLCCCPSPLPGQTIIQGGECLSTHSSHWNASKGTIDNGYARSQLYLQEIQTTPQEPIWQMPRNNNIRSTTYGRIIHQKCMEERWSSICSIPWHSGCFPKHAEGTTIGKHESEENPRRIL